MPLSEVAVDDAEWPAIYRQLGAVLARIHRIAQPAYGYVTTEVLDPVADNSDYMRGLFSSKLDAFDAHDGDRRLGELVQRYVARHAGLFGRCEGPVLCHNDLHEGNVLVSRAGERWVVSGIVDLENAMAADPLLDLAKTDCYSIRGDQAKLSGLVEGYGSLPADWIQRVELYRLYHALDLWTWFASIGRTEPLAGIAQDMADIVG